MKILFVFTGGTIGSVEKDGVADVERSTAARIAAFTGEDEENIETAFPYNILSENASCGTLSAITSYMLAVDHSKYDGVIVTHGSDTLAYTATMLAHALSWVDKPVVITAANYVMSDPRSNAEANVKAAYDFIAQKRCGVYAVWKNDGEQPRVHLAAKLLEADGALDRFDSWGGEAFGVMDDGVFIRTKNESELDRILPDKRLEFLKNRKLDLKNNVLFIHSRVGLDHRDYNLKGKAAVLLKLYHSGTACMTGESCSFGYLADICKKNGVDLYITPAKRGSYIYRSAQGFGETSAHPIYNTSDIAAYTKLMLAYSLEDEERAAVIKTLL